MIARMAMWVAILGGVATMRVAARCVGGDSWDILAPIAAIMIQMAVPQPRGPRGRHRRGPARRRDPLAHALSRSTSLQEPSPFLAINPAVSHVFLQSPFRARGSRSCPVHPPLEERLAQLR